jgi:hypothetical protein
MASVNLCNECNENVRIVIVNDYELMRRAVLGIFTIIFYIIAALGVVQKSKTELQDKCVAWPDWCWWLTIITAILWAVIAVLARKGETDISASIKRVGIGLEACSCCPWPHRPGPLFSFSGEANDGGKGGPQTRGIMGVIRKGRV